MPDIKPPDLDQAGNPIEAKPPDLDATGKPITASPTQPATTASADSGWSWVPHWSAIKDKLKGKVDDFLLNHLDQMAGKESGILNPDPEQNPLLAKSVLPEATGATSWVGKGAQAVYNNLLRPIASPVGALGTAMGTSPIEEPIPNPTEALAGIAEKTGIKPRVKLNLDGTYTPIDEAGNVVGEPFKPDFKTTANVPTEQPIASATDINTMPPEPPAQSQSLGDTLKEAAKTPISSAVDVTKSLVTAGHFSAPFRQSAGLIHQPAWWRAWGPMIKSWGEEGYEQVNNMIRSDPNYELAVNSGIDFTKLGEKLAEREDAIRSKIAEKIPGVGEVVKAGNRGYTAFNNVTRIGTFSNIVDDASNSAAGIADQSLKQLADPKTNPQLARSIADYVNAASGRGSLGSFEKYSKELNTVLFSPRFQAAKIQLVKQLFDPSTPDIVRGNVIKTLASQMGIGTTIAALGKWAGADVSLNPTSADFGKVKIGDTRIDPWQGIQQDVVFLSRLATAVRTSSTTGKSTELGVGYGAPTRASVTADFLANKTSPPFKVAYDWATNHRVKNNQWSFEPAKEAAGMIAPILVKTVYNLMQSDPNLIPIIGPLNAVGIGVETYGSSNSSSAPQLTGVPGLASPQAPRP